MALKTSNKNRKPAEGCKPVEKTVDKLETTLYNSTSYLESIGWILFSLAIFVFIVF